MRSHLDTDLDTLFGKTKITTRYALCPTSKLQRRLHRRETAPKPGVIDPPTTDEMIQGTLILKTYDPVSGTVLKYRTDRAAEVGRLVAGLHKCGTVMAAQRKTLEPGSGDTKREDEKLAEDQTVVGSSSGAKTTESKRVEHQQQQGRGTGGGRKKKKR